MPDLQATFEAHRDDGLEFIGVQLLGLDSIAEGQEFIDDFGITYAVGPDADGSLIINYDVIGFPTTVFVDRDHNVVRKWTGPLNREKLEDLVAVTASIAEPFGPRPSTNRVPNEVLIDAMSGLNS